VHELDVYIIYSANIGEQHIDTRSTT